MCVCVDRRCVLLVGAWEAIRIHLTLCGKHFVVATCIIQLVFSWIIYFVTFWKALWIRVKGNLCNNICRAFFFTRYDRHARFCVCLHIYRQVLAFSFVLIGDWTSIGWRDAFFCLEICLFMSWFSLCYSRTYMFSFFRQILFVASVCLFVCYGWCIHQTPITFSGCINRCEALYYTYHFIRRAMCQAMALVIFEW